MFRIVELFNFADRCSDEELGAFSGKVAGGRGEAVEQIFRGRIAAIEFRSCGSGAGCKGVGMKTGDRGETVTPLKHGVPSRGDAEPECGEEFTANEDDCVRRQIHRANSPVCQRCLRSAQKSGSQSTGC